MALANANDEHRRVTRAQFVAFQRCLPGLPAHVIGLLDAIPADQRSKPLEVGRSVCLIEIPKVGRGTGWHLGNGWVVTNTHVICGSEQYSSAASATFAFPTHSTITSKPRTVLFTKQEALIGLPRGGMQVDLALIHVPEINKINENMQRRATDGEKVKPANDGEKVKPATDERAEKILPLIDTMQRPANAGERVYLIHYGSGIDESPRPQQFSVTENFAQANVQNQHGSVSTLHSAQSRPGSSGAPLLVYEEQGDVQDGKFLVAGVHYGKEISIQNPQGLAACFHNEQWLQKTIFATATENLKHYIDVVKHCQTQGDGELLDTAIKVLNECLSSLQNNLTRDYFRLEVPLGLPDVEGLVDCPDIIWNPN